MVHSRAHCICVRGNASHVSITGGHERKRGFRKTGYSLSISTKFSGLQRPTAAANPGGWRILFSIDSIGFVIPPAHLQVLTSPTLISSHSELVVRVASVSASSGTATINKKSISRQVDPPLRTCSSLALFESEFNSRRSCSITV